MKANNTITKSKYKALQQELTDKLSTKIGEDTIQEILHIMCNVLQFDPNASSYNKERMHKIMEETGKTSYELFNKKSYDQNKEVISKIVAERQRAKRSLKKMQTHDMCHSITVI